MAGGRARRAAAVIAAPAVLLLWRIRGGSFPCKLRRCACCYRSRLRPGDDPHDRKFHQSLLRLLHPLVQIFDLAGTLSLASTHYARASSADHACFTCHSGYGSGRHRATIGGVMHMVADRDRNYNASARGPDPSTSTLPRLPAHAATFAPCGAIRTLSTECAPIARLS